MKTTITCEQCGIEMTCHTDYIGVKNADGEHLGHIYSADPADDWEKIANGACPICDGWEDGLGHACTAAGWGAVTPEGGHKMTITMDYQEYNKMQEFAKQFAAKAGGVHPRLECVKLTITGDTAKAEALDGYKAGYIILNLSNSDEDGEMLLPVTSKLKKSDGFAVITELEKEIEIKTATGARIYRKLEGGFVNTSDFYPQDEPAEIFGFNPSLLADALKAFKSEKVVKIEYRGALRPLVIKSSTAQALVLPVRLPQ